MAFLGAGAPPAVAADNCPNAAIRAQQNTTFLPDCRGFELIGPPDSAGYTVQGFAAQPDGEAFYWKSPAIEQGDDPAPADGALADVFLAHRSAQGWSSTWLTPNPVGVFFSDARNGLPGMQADGYVFLTGDRWTAPAGATPLALFLGAGGASSPLLSAAPGTAEQAGLDNFQWTTSEDLSSTVFVTTAKLDSADTDSSADIYVRRGDTLSLVSQRTDGTTDNTTATPFLPRAASGGKAGTAGDSYLGSGSLSQTGFPVSQGGSPVSPDGRSVVFSTTASLDAADTDTAADLYLWREGQGVSLISDDERGAAGCPTAPGSTTDCTGATADVSFVGMSQDASVIYFRTREGLVDSDTDGGNDIYRYEVNGTGGQQLTRATGAGSSNAVWPVSVTVDGQLFFAATDRLGTDPPSGTGVVLYRWDGSAIDTVSTLTDADVFAFNPSAGTYGDLVTYGIASEFPVQRAVRATADGSALLFRTTAALDATDTDSAADLYLWRAGKGVTLVSGTGSAAVALGTNTDGAGPTGNNYPAMAQGRVISADASRVFFVSTDALTADAGDNGRAKLYEWHDGTGIDLVSPAGNDAGAVTYVDNGADGANVFFMTGDALVSGDTDGGAIDTYDARIGGGFPEPPAPPAPCTGDACQGAPSVIPAVPALGTPAFAGVGNVSPPAVTPTKPVAKIKVKAAKRSVRGTRTTVRVSVPEAGKVRASGSGLRRSSVTAKKAKSYKVSVRLSQRSARRLERGHRVKVRVTVRFTPKHGKGQRARVHLTFKRKASAKKAGLGTGRTVSGTDGAGR